MSDPAGFVFVDDPASFRDADARIARVPVGVRSKRALLSVLAQELEFPAYFGFNWDALDDCLRDLHWLPETPRRIVLLHAALPLRSPSHRRIYLNVLRHAISAWGPGEAHELLAVFPRSADQCLSELK